MLLWAFHPDNPYGYYTLLRIILCALCAYLAVIALKKGMDAWVWMLAVTAIIYNPLVRFHLTREIWSVVNIATIILLVMTYPLLRKCSIAEKINNPNETN